MDNCCCKNVTSNKSSASCLGRCDLPKHKCLDKEAVKPGPVPKYMGWLYTARDSPEHQLRCGWRPGHISCPVLKRIELHNSIRSSDCCSKCSKSCPRSPSKSKPCRTPKCIPICPSHPSAHGIPSCCKQGSTGQPIIRIVRHGGNYSICTKPSNISNAPTGPYPLKYVLNVRDDADDKAQNDAKEIKYSVEAKFNDYHFDYTSSQSSFILDFSPPEPSCNKPCPKKLIQVMDD